ncbi:MAG: rod shape-determining protein RodA [Pseudomonadota bacterium]|nr:rod shape-determining protein RodA [Pseudomonadota bacterium]
MKDYARYWRSGAHLGQDERRNDNFHLDPMLLLPLLCIMGIGLMVLYSAVHRDLSILENQSAKLLVGFIAMTFAAWLHPGVYRRLAPLLYAIGLISLVAVFLFGTTAKGSQRWLDLPLLPRFQPSELMKVTVPLTVAWFLHDRPLPPRAIEVGIALVLAAIPAGLVVQQPDLGTGILIMAGGLVVVLLSGIRWRSIFLGALALVPFVPAYWYLFLTEYQKKRVFTFFDPESDPLGAGWSIIQSTTALGSGGLLGKGLFEGTQSRLEFLPESNTDFIMAVIGEELGFMGVMTLIILYVLVLARGMHIAVQAGDTFGRLAAGGLTLTFFVHVVLNIAVVSGLLPVTGAPLPLVSFGGTSAIALLIGFGIVMSIHTHRGWR